MKLARVTLGVVVLLALSREVLLACSCSSSPLLEAFDRAPLVFVGVMLERRDRPPSERGMISSSDPAECTFYVEELLKGDVSDTVRVCTSRDGASCGYSFRVGTTYLVYASSREDGRPGDCSYSVSLCSRTAETASARGEIALLYALAELPPDVKPEERERRLVETAKSWLSDEETPKLDVIQALSVLAPASRSTARRVAALWREGDLETKHAILRAFGRFDDDTGAVLDVCVDACRQEDASLRRVGLQTLTRLAPGSGRAQDAVFEMMADPDQEIRESAAWVLAQWPRDERESGAAVIRRALGRGPIVRRVAAIDAIDRGAWSDQLSWRDLEPMFESDSMLWRIGAFTALPSVEVDSAAADRLLHRGLRDPERGVRYAAAEAAASLAYRRMPIASILELALADTTSTVAEAAARGIGLLPRGSKDACRLAAIAAADPRPWVRYEGLRSALGLDGCSASINRSLAFDPFPKVRALALEGMVGWRSRQGRQGPVEDATISGLEHTDPEMVREILRVVDLYPNKTRFALEHVARLTSHPDSLVRIAALGALETLQRRAPEQGPVVGPPPLDSRSPPDLRPGRILREDAP